ncbi:uncharacterized protein AMSG_03774 [Thecamonas trahens ATCC 50062]|uniref:Uncharacterized protein n=1 Tax=Thecamonas trahens ATCC 50062 TaxID=461836 RepID=A0A0L0D518_THETB|nr:hypothetical protein AMSG_03774 [Thecamonas trahens ATCC 50062]KNC47340.1 hypothetical protein AMSG_03774 [Thecamonas trahens ATCC 50062]|eukprot:XP_013759678.1 hypothetical protein AMSG_03774 [Thecamonas trahens ATCC 50062]
MRDLRLEFVFPCTVETFAELVFGGDGFARAFHTAISNHSLAVGGWRPPPADVPTGQSMRLLEYASPIQAPALLQAYLGSATAVVETQVYSWRAAGRPDAALPEEPWPLAGTNVADGRLPPDGCAALQADDEAAGIELPPELEAFRVDVVNRFRGAIGPYITSEGCYLAEPVSDASDAPATRCTITARVGWAGSFVVQSPMERYMLSSAAEAFRIWGDVAADYVATQLAADTATDGGDASRDEVTASENAAECDDAAADAHAAQAEAAKAEEIQFLMRRLAALGRGIDGLDDALDRLTLKLEYA